jgi:tetratricopeptide (TPR) repeat protein
VALLCAGWLAGRGPLGATTSDERVAAAVAAPAGVGDPLAVLSGAGSHRATRALPNRRDLSALRERLRARELGPLRIAVAVAAIVGALLAAWVQWQPQRSADAAQQALALVARDPRGALQSAQTAVARDPLSAQALFTLSAVERASGGSALARATLQRAVRLQPSNPQTWLTLGEYDLAGNPRAAVDELGAAIYLNPESVAPEAIAQGNPEAITIQNDYVQALRTADTQAVAAAAARTRARSRASAGFAKARRSATRRAGARRVKTGH